MRLLTLLSSSVLTLILTLVQATPSYIPYEQLPICTQEIIEYNYSILPRISSGSKTGYGFPTTGYSAQTDRRSAYDKADTQSYGQNGEASSYRKIYPQSSAQPGEYSHSSGAEPKYSSQRVRKAYGPGPYLGYSNKPIPYIKCRRQ